MQTNSSTDVSDVATGDFAMLGANDPPSPVLSQPRTTKRARDIQEDELHHMMYVSCDISDDDDVGPRPTWTAATDLLCTEAAVIFHDWVRTRAYTHFKLFPKRMRTYTIMWGPQDGSHFYVQGLLRALTTTSKSLILVLQHVWRGQQAFNWSKGAKCTLLADH
jgi:hypothetical protein